MYICGKHSSNNARPKCKPNTQEAIDASKLYVREHPVDEVLRGGSVVPIRDAHDETEFPGKC